MKIPTQYYKVDYIRPRIRTIAMAASHITAGQLVAFPTETVYGLGADAFQPAAVDKIFAVKGRPAGNPLLVHVSNMAQVRKLAAVVPPEAEKLMQRFWPGPLSVVLPSLASVPEAVRGGGDGVGLRMPSHPVALALIEVTGPLAAPSANRHGRPSPTSAEHVRQDLDGLIAAVLDAGETGTGMESTLIDLTDHHYRILRRGCIGVELIEECLGRTLEIDLPECASYQTPVKVVLSESIAEFESRVDEAGDMAVGIVCFTGSGGYMKGRGRRLFSLDPSGTSFGLYSIIREAEAAGIEVLLFPPFDSVQVDEAWQDRLRRAVK